MSHLCLSGIFLKSKLVIEFDFEIFALMILNLPYKQSDNFIFNVIGNKYLKNTYRKCYKIVLISISFRLHKYHTIVLKYIVCVVVYHLNNVLQCSFVVLNISFTVQSSFGDIYLTCSELIQPFIVLLYSLEALSQTCEKHG